MSLRACFASQVTVGGFDSMPFACITFGEAADLRFQMSSAIASRSAFNGVQRFSRSHFSRFSLGERSITVPVEAERLERSSAL
jgi:hypothetical protein